MSSTICDSCHAGCCRTYRLIITILDFLDLANNLGLDKAVQGVSFEPTPYNLDYMNNKQMMLPFIFDNQDKKGFVYSLALKRVESGLFPGTLKCNFLDESLRPEQQINPELPNHAEHPGSRAEARCSVYENRPTMCRTYPIGLNPQNYVSVLKRREDLPTAQQNSVYKICPKEHLELKDFGLDKPGAIAKKSNDLLLNDIRTKAHNEIVLRWNSQPERLLEKLVPFILSVGNSLIQAPPRPQVQNQTIPPIIQTNTVPNAASATEALKKKKKYTVAQSSGRQTEETQQVETNNE